MYENLLNTITEINDKLAAVKVEFAAMIKDQAIPLELRWEMFTKANDAVKEHDSYCTSFDSLPDDFIRYEGYYHMDRNQTSTTLDLIEYIEGNIADNNAPENAKFVDEKEKVLFNSIDLNALKEEILADNTGSFTYDW